MSQLKLSASRVLCRTVNSDSVDKIWYQWGAHLSSYINIRFCDVYDDVVKDVVPFGAGSGVSILVENDK